MLKVYLDEVQYDTDSLVLGDEYGYRNKGRDVQAKLDTTTQKGMTIDNVQYDLLCQEG